VKISNPQHPLANFQDPFAFSAMNGRLRAGIYKESMQKDVPDWRMAMADC